MEMRNSGYIDCYVCRDRAINWNEAAHRRGRTKTGTNRWKPTKGNIMERNKTVNRRARSRLAQAKAVDCCRRPTQPGGTGPHLGRSCPRPSRRNTRVDTTRGKQQGTQQLTTAAKGCLLQASRLQQIAATGKTQRVNEKWWVYVG